ncbi:MAG: hypothetical protein EOO01_21490 [Chitinophagaceae bacterium]|nr:MAG: hypothetical protein EOO01_21490 [Chitinophagaceae bacterium]
MTRMENQELLERVIASFDNNDSETLISLVSEDFEWEILGEQHIKGKENLRKMFAEMDKPVKMLGSTKVLRIFDGNNAACNGVVTMQNENGETNEHFYCDLYELQGGRLRKMTTYMVRKT